MSSKQSKHELVSNNRQFTLYQLFEQQVNKTPNNVALVFAGQSLSYQQLNQKANRLAHVIRQKYQAQQGYPMAPDTLIALYLERSIEMVTAILAVFKAGGAYVPLSPDNPKARTLYLLNDTATRLVVSQTKYKGTLDNGLSELNASPSVLIVDDEPLLLDAPLDNLLPMSEPNDLAYVIYTSGTTGQPKGVMIEHQGVVTLIGGQTKAFDFTPEEVVVWLASYTFDASVEQLFLPLLNGALLYIPKIEDVKAANRLKQQVVQLGVTHLHATPGYLSALGEFPRGHRLKRVISGGDVIHSQLKLIWGDLLINEYGPTEHTVTALQCLDYAKQPGINCIGKPVDQTLVYVLNAHNEPVPIGTPGELHIGGAGVARGYLNLPQLTAERFINDPLVGTKNARMYKTGDMACWRADGNLEYLGRNDLQVKIRGFRIELEEIQSALTDLPQVKEAEVIDIERAQDRYLAAYIVVQSGLDIDVTNLKAKLSARLPEYMVPSTFTFIDAIPLTVNGKLDKQALPEPEYADDGDYVAPKDSLEQQLCHIWQVVLAQDQVGVKDNFFALGGDSVSAIRMTTKIYEEMAVEVPLAVLMEQPDISRLAAIMQNSLVGGEDHAIVHVQQSNSCPLSFSQTGLLFIETFSGDHNLCHLPFFVKLNAPHIDLLQQAFNVLINHHQVLKSVYLTDDDKTVLRVLDDEVLIKTLSVADDKQLSAQVEADINTPFDLTAQLPIKLHHYVVGQADNKRDYLLIVIHHIAFDGWSTDIFIQQLAEVYQAGGQDSLPQLSINYADYVLWEHQQLADEGVETKQLLTYWQDQLKGFESLVLATDKTRPALLDYKGADFEFVLDEAMSAQLRQLARTQQTTLYTVLLSAFYVTLAAMSGQTDVVVGTTSDNRQNAQTQSLIGLFVHSLVLRAQVDGQQSIEALIDQVHHIVSEGKIHQQLPFEKLVKALDIHRDASCHPIFQVMFGVQHFFMGKAADHPVMNELDFSPVEDHLKPHYHPARYDLSLFLDDGASQITGVLNYASSLFECSTMARMAGLYTQVLRGFVETEPKTQTVGDMPLLPSSEQQTLLYGRNLSKVAYSPTTLHQLFEAQVEKNPGNIALVFAGQSLSYNELNEKANQLAHVIRATYLTQLGYAMVPDTLIALYLERSVAMIISILAVLKAGGAYVPISPKYPQERVQFMLEDTASTLIITCQQHQSSLCDWDVKRILTVDSLPDLPGSYSANLEPISTQTDLAYVLYTSGTTGKPKGVLTPHQAVVSLLLANTQINLGEEDVLVHLSDPNFDAATFEIWGALLHGAKLAIVGTKQNLDAVQFGRFLKTNRVSVLWLTKSLFDSFYVAQPELFNDLRCLLIGGEALNPDLISKLVQQDKRPEIILNGYGPTESTIFTTLWRCEKFNGSSVPLGKPTNNRQVYVLNEQGYPLPVGCPGELYIGGAGLARGYLNRPELTAQSFSFNPLINAVLYKTGDLVRWSPGGNLEYLGRNDSQVKIRGFRIELDEIEGALSKLPTVKQAVVVDYERNNNRYLAAYIVAQPSQAQDGAALSHSLSISLPDYMVPSTFTYVDAIPLTINGKLDRQALPDPEWVSADSYVAPKNSLERQLCDIWQEVLGLERAGVEDNFFAVGGNSVSAIRMTALIAKRLRLEVPLVLLFDQPDITRLARYMAQNPTVCNNSIIPHEYHAHYPLSFAQERLLFIESFEQGSDAYHIRYFVKLHDADMAVLADAFNLVMDRHPVLKTVYLNAANKGNYQQLLSEKVLIQTHLPDANRPLLSKVRKHISQPFDLSAEPSLRIHHYLVAPDDLDGQVDENSGFLLILFHHIAFDGWSLEIFMRELAEAYQAYSHQREPNLPELDISYGDYAQWQRERLQGEVLEKLLSYWRQQMTGFETSALPTDYPRPTISNYRGNDFYFALDKDLSKQLRTLAKSQQTTLFTVMLSGFYVTLAALSGQTDVVVGSPSDNRHHFQTQQLIGFFANSIALRAQVEGCQSITALIEQVHKVVTTGKAHEALPFEKLVEMLKVERDTSRHPVYQVMFSMQSFEGVKDSGVMANLPIESVDKETEQSLAFPARFDMSLLLNDGQSSIEGEFNYSMSLFELSTVERMAAVYQRVLRAFVDEQQQTLAINRIELLSTDERKVFLHDWYPANFEQTQQTFAQLFEAQVVDTPQKTALVFGGQSLTYQQLNEKANQLAYVIRASYQRQHQEPMVPDTLIALYLERSFDTVIAILAVLKAGGAYVPIDVSFPTARVVFILDDTHAPAILSTALHHDKLSLCIDQAALSPLLMEVDDSKLTNQSPTTNLASLGGPQDLAYVLYTSGTTGKPKGVMLNQATFAYFIAQASAYLTDSLACQRVSTLSLTQYTFDIFGLEYGVTLATGGQLLLSQISTAHQDLLPYQSVVNFIQQTPSLWQLFLQEPELGSLDKTLLKKMQIMVGGESGSLNLFTRLEGLFDKVHQVYGPTETCIWSTRCVYHEGRQKVIGKPFTGEQIYVLSDALQLKPTGAPGQLYIGGMGLARGYLNRPQLTRAAFVDNPFDGGRTLLYKTGDRVRRLTNGQLEFLGRDGGQVKMRGYRIELGEIERVLSRHETVNTAVVIFDKQPINARLLAYVSLDDTLEITEQQIDDTGRVLRDWLKGHLPGYMVPAHISVLDKFVLNASGKINRKALKLPSADKPRPQVLTQAINTEPTTIEPNSRFEQQIVGIWQDLLQLERVSVDETFFDLGGHSLLMVKLKSRLDAVLDQPVSLLNLFQYPTIKSLLAHLLPAQKTPTGQQAQSVSDKIEDIAIIGMAGRFPGAANVDEFWLNLCDGVPSITKLTDEQLLEQGVDPDTFNHPDYVKFNGLLADTELFDASFFGYTPFEAQIIDPQQRLFLETCWTGIEHAGFDVQRLDTSVGVFAGMGSQSYLQRHLMTNPKILARQGEYKLMISNANDYMTTRVAYKLGLKGPAIGVQTACSTSLVAVHMACQSLRQGECHMALAGGVTVNFPQQGYLYQEGMILSKDGRCRAFDAQAQGTVAGAGVGVVVLTPLSRALAQGNTILGVIKGSAINNDGTDKVSFTAPSVNGQAAVIAKAMKGLDFESVSYIEAHGTGTPLGDPIEVAALTQAYQSQTAKTGYCAIGAVKTNIGHLDVAAGIAGLIKTVQALRHQKLPPSLNYQRPNPNIDFAKTPFYVNQQLTPWKASEPLRAGISSFGIGGTNAHVVVEQAPANVHSLSAIKTVKPWQLLCLSAKTKTALARAVDHLTAHLNQHPEQSLADVAYTLHMGRQVFDHRQFVVCQADKVNVLETRMKKRHVEEAPNGVVFMFPGQGAQYVNMGKGLYQHEPVFKDIVDQCADWLLPDLGLDLRDVMYGQLAEFDTKALTSTQLAQPALFVTEYALAQLCLSWGIKPCAMTGHSLGEYVAATLAGVFSLKDALKLVAARGALMQSMPPGDMLSVALSQKEVENLLVEGVALAANNTPEQCVVSGSSESMAVFIKVLEHQLIVPAFKRLQTSHAFHSVMMEDILPSFRQQLRQITLNPPNQLCLSNVTGQWLTPQQATSVDYWCAHVMQTVRFCDGIKTLLEHNKEQTKHCVFLEVGPGRALSSMVRKHQGTTVFGGIKPATSDEPDQAFLLSTVGQFWLHNVNLDWAGFYAGQERFRVPLPTYSFDGVRHWVEPGNEQKTFDAQSTGNVLEPLPKTQWLSAPNWVCVCNLASRQNKRPFESVLLFVTTHQVQTIDFSELSEQLLLIVIDQSVMVIDEDKAGYIRLNPTSESAFEQLVDKVMKQKAYDAIIHLASADTEYKTDDPLEQGFNLLFMIEQYLLPKLNIEHLLVLTRQLAQISNKNSINPFNGAMVGGIRSISHQYPQVSSLVIDIDDKIACPKDGSKLTADFSFLSVILRSPELYQTHTLLAIRFGKLWCQQRQIVKPLSDPDPVIEDNDTLLITDGAGTMGLAIAGYISIKHDVNFILLIEMDGRLGPWASAKINEIKANGCQVDIRQVDITDFDAVKEMMHAVETQYKAIDGIIHTKGITPVGVIQESLAMEKNSIAHRVQGIDHILKALSLKGLQGLKRLKFLVNNASLASVVGHGHPIEYCAANGYLDYLCANRPYFNNTRVVTINWPVWSEGGTDNGQPSQENLVSEGEGTELFYLLLNQGAYEQIIVSKLDIDELRAQSFLVEDEATDNAANNEGWTLVDEDCSDMEYRTAGVFYTLLGVDEISIEDDFFKLGGDSLLAVQLMVKLKDAGISIDMNSIINADSIKTIARNAANKVQGSDENELVVSLKIRPNNTQNVFFIHPVGGTVILYKAITDKLPADYNYYGIQNINIYHKQLLSADTLEELANVYVDALLKIQPDGEFRLAGSSLGGTIAYEMASQLIASGRKIVFVAMLDTWATYSAAFRDKSKFQADMKRQQSEYGESLIDVDESARELMLEASWGLMQLLTAYHPRHSDVTVHLYKANRLNDIHATNNGLTDNGWGQYNSHKINVYMIEGDHATIHKGAGLLQICNHFNQHLQDS
jgi:amino acid adenylation domain-containing protein